MSEQSRSSAGNVSVNRLVMPVALVGAIVAVIVGGKTWLDAQFYEVRREVLDLGYEIKAMREQYAASTQDRITGRDMVIWVSRLRGANPALSVPDISDLLNDRR